MADDFNIVLEMLRAIRGEFADLKEGQRRAEQRLSAIERGLAGVEHGLADLRLSITGQRDDLGNLRARVERIERRLDLHEPEH